MAKTLEDRIVWEGQHFYVFEVRRDRFEVRKHGRPGCGYSTVVGWGPDRAQVIRTAEGLERYPDVWTSGRVK